MLLSSFTFLLCWMSVAGMVLNGTSTVSINGTEKCTCTRDIQHLYSIVETLQQLYPRMEALETSMMEKTAANYPANMDSRAVFSDVIGFTAVLDHAVTDLPVGSTIVFDGIRYNAGGAYDSSTGIFTCPRDGMYMFAIFIQATKMDTVSASLRINGGVYVNEVSEQAIEYQDSTGGNVLVHHLVKGDRVWVQTYGDDNQDTYPHFTTFSGALIHSTSSLLIQN